MNKFPTKKLGEVIELRYGKGISKYDRKDNGKYIIYGANGELGRTDKYLVQGDAVIVGRKGSAGEITRVSGKFWPSDVAYYVLGNEKIDINYLFYLLKSLNLQRFAVGVKPGINRNRIYEIEIPLPPLEIQKKIVERIEKLMGKIDEVKKLRKEAMAEASSLIPSALHKIFEEGEKKGWEEVSFGSKKYLEIIDGDRGKNYPKKSDFSQSGYCLFLNTSNVRYGSFNFTRCDFVSKDKDEALRKGKLKRGDVVLTTRGTLGNSAYYDESVPYDYLRINSGMVILRVDPKKLSQKFLLYILNSPTVIALIKEANSGSAQPQLPIKVLSKINFILPPLSEQREIAKYLDSLAEKVRKIQTLQLATERELKLLGKAVLNKEFMV